MPGLFLTLIKFLNMAVEVKSKNDLIKELRDAVIEEIKKDVLSGDLTVLEELLTAVTPPVLLGSLPEEQADKFALELKQRPLWSPVIGTWDGEDHHGITIEPVCKVGGKRDTFVVRVKWEEGFETIEGIENLFFVNQPV